MINKIIVLLFIITVTFKVATAKPIEEDESFIEKLHYKYENDTWTCFDVECPVDTFGCRINIRTDKDDRKVVYQSFTCLDKDMNAILGAGDRIELSKPKVVNINIETYIGAESYYGTGYGLGGHENANGVVAVNDLSSLKESAKQNKKVVVDSNP